MSDGSQNKLVLRAPWATKPKPTKPQDALQVRKLHLDLLALTSRRLEALGASERPGDVPGALMYVARDLARRFFWTALRFKRAYVAVELARTIQKRFLAEAALASATTARQAFRLEGDLSDDKLDANLQNDVDICRSKLTGLDADISTLQAKVTEMEQALEAERNAALRKAASEKLARDLDAVDKALPACLDAGRCFVSALEELHHNFEATQMATFLANALSQVEVASGFVLQELRGTVRGIADATMPIPTAKPDATPIPAPEPAPPTQMVFMLKSAKFRDQDGQKRFAGQWEDAIMPVATAQRAMRRDVAVTVADPRRAQLRGARGGDFNPQAADVVDLDAIEEPTRAPIIEPGPVLREANFTVIDRSAETRTIQISAPRM